MKHARSLIATIIGGLMFATTGFVNAAGMQTSSTSFADAGMIPTLYGGNTDGCGGNGISPQVSWSNLPAGTKSVAVLLADPDGANGLGVSHWVVYNISSGRGKLRQGEGQVDGDGVTVGKNVGGATAYRGMCPPVGDLPHHYIMTVVATDLDPAVLPPGLTREALLAALKGHALGGQSIVGRYGR
jgi:Raf kinase inhibitor-like YbhB/YbcL family protein